MHCDPGRASVCAGHEQEVICVHNFMRRSVALETRLRLDKRHAQLLASQPAAARRRHPLPHREAGSEFNQTEVHPRHSRPLKSGNPPTHPNPRP